MLTPFSYCFMRLTCFYNTKQNRSGSDWAIDMLQTYKFAYLTVDETSFGTIVKIQYAIAY